MPLSARNQLRGTIKSMTKENILSEVVVMLGDGQEIVSVITTSSVNRLNLQVGQSVTVVIKSTEVMLATDV